MIQKEHNKKNPIDIFHTLAEKYFIPNDVVTDGHQRMMLYVMNALAMKAMYGELEGCSAATAIGNALMYRAEDYATVFVEKGSLTKGELTSFMGIFEDWEREYDAPLQDEIAAFKVLISEANA